MQLENGHANRKCAMLLPNGQVLRKNRGVTTGYESTLGDNTAMHIIALRAATFRSNNPHPNCLVMGDDNKLHHPPNFNFDTFRAHMLRMGLPISQVERGT